MVCWSWVPNNRAIDVHSCEVNWGPLSDDMSIGMPKTGNAVGDWVLCTTGGGCVIEGNGLWPARKSIYHCEEVGETIGGWQWPYIIHVNMVKSVLWNTELLKWSSDVGTLPNDFCSNQFSCTTY